MWLLHKLVIRVWVPLEQEPYYLGVHIRAADFWKLPFEFVLCMCWLHTLYAMAHINIPKGALSFNGFITGFR